LPRGLRPCRSGGASSATLRPACACDRAGQSGGRSLAVPFASLRAGVSTRRSGRSGPARSGAIGLRPLGGLGHPPPLDIASAQLPWRGRPRPRTTASFHDSRPVAGPPTWGRGCRPIRRCRGWPSCSCARGSRTGEPRRGVDGPERSEGNSEGPRRGSPCPVAGAGACGLGRGGARARIPPPAGPASKRPPRSGRKNANEPERLERNLRYECRSSSPVTAGRLHRRLTGPLLRPLRKSGRAGAAPGAP